MSFFTRIMRWFESMFKKQAKEEFKIKQITTDTMDSLISQCARVYVGNPDWVDSEDHITTVNFAKTICAEVATLTTLAIKVQIGGGARADWMQSIIDKLYFQLREWVEYGCAYGTAILKPSGDEVSLILPDNFIVVSKKQENITAAVFIDHANVDNNYYTKLEYHRFLDDEVYMITNKTYVSNSKNKIGDPCNIEDSPWSDLLPEVGIQGLDRPLFAVLRTPKANNVEIGSPLGLPVYYDALEELKDLDIAYSRNSKEIKDSKRTVLLDSDRLLPSGMPIKNTAGGFESAKDGLGLPDYVKAVYGDGRETFYQEINPTLQTDMRITGINNLLSQIGFKCGFANGYFVLDQKTGMITATQVEADDRRTIQTIKDTRDKLEKCIDDLLYSLNAFADLYNLAPAGTYEVTYDFGDITYNREEDRMRWWQYVQAGKVPAWMYFVKFEGMTEEDAKAMAEETKVTQPLFGEE